MSEDTQYDDNEMFGLTPEFAHVLATLPVDELLAHYGEEALLIARFIQSRERQELDPPTQEEIVAIVEWYHKMQADQSLLRLTLRGFAWIDWDGTEPVWKISPEGAEVAGK